jgi:hypothetical protein
MVFSLDCRFNDGFHPKVKRSFSFEMPDVDEKSEGASEGEEKYIFPLKVQMNESANDGGPDE